MEEEKSGSRIPKNLRLPLLLASVIIPTILIYGLYKFNAFSKVSSLLPNPSSSPIASDTPQASPSPSPSPMFTDKDLLKVRIYNGTGIRGQAGRIGDALALAGLKNILTANTARRTDETEVSFSKKVSPDTKSEVLEVLKNNFISVAEVTQSVESEFDIEIITGR